MLELALGLCRNMSRTLSALVTEKMTYRTVTGRQLPGAYCGAVRSPQPCLGGGQVVACVI